MEASINHRPNKNKHMYNEDTHKIAYEFSKKAYKEFGSFVKALVLFGGVAKGKATEKSDIDILVVVDDIHIAVTNEMVEAYRVIIERLVQETSPKIHVTTLKFTTFYDYIRKGDPIAINILRDGVAMIDTGFFDPMQALLNMGKIRPTQESINIYKMRSGRSLEHSRYNVIQATLDLYWAVMDAGHACLMSKKIVPPSPEHVADLIERELYQKSLISKKYVKIAHQFYDLMKMITHRDIKEITGKQYENYYQQAVDFVETMNNLAKH